MNQPKRASKWQPTFTTPLFRSQDWILPSMILGALFIHGIAFYLIQAAAPENSRKIPASARLAVLNPKNSRDRASLEWIANHDPAAMSYQAPAPVPAELLAGERYQPSYEKVLPEPLPMVIEEKQLQHQSIFPPGPVPEMQSRKALPKKEWPELASRVVPSPGVVLRPDPPLAPPLITGDIPTPTRFLVVGADEMVSVFLLQSSGNDNLDSYARQWLSTAVSLKDRPASGWVEIDWGREIWKKAAR